MEGTAMKKNVWVVLLAGAGALGLAAYWAGAGSPALSAEENISLSPDDIGGTLNGPRGPEAGVWVIAETSSLPTKFTKIVVTDEKGRFVIPGLPHANYNVWVRGYGLVDSPKTQSAPGKLLALKA